MTQRSFPHLLSHTQAKALARAALADYQQKLAQYAVTVNWREESLPDTAYTADAVADVAFIVLGSLVKGTVTVNPADIVLRVDIPLKLKLFEGMAVKIVAGELEKCVGQARKEFPTGASQAQAR